MLRLLQLEELEALLLEVPSLVSRFEVRNPGFSATVLNWLKRVESALANSRLPVAAEVATMRGRLLAADRGSVPADRAARRQPTKRQHRDRIAASVVEEATGVIQAAIAPARARVEESERVVRQVLAVAQQRGMVLALGESGSTSQLVSLLGQLRGEAELAPATTHAVGLVGAQDVLILIDRALSQLGV